MFKKHRSKCRHLALTLNNANPMLKMLFLHSHHKRPPIRQIPLESRRMRSSWNPCYECSPVFLKMTRYPLQTDSTAMRILDTFPHNTEMHTKHYLPQSTLFSFP